MTPSSMRARSELILKTFDLEAHLAYYRIHLFRRVTPDVPKRCYGDAATRSNGIKGDEHKPIRNRRVRPKSLGQGQYQTYRAERES
jgi:hypothetical protein